MSYLLDGTNDWLKGTFTTAYDTPLTLACHIKYTDHTADALRGLMTLGTTDGTIDQTQSIWLSSTDDAFRIWSRTTGTSFVDVTDNNDGVWVGIVGVFTASDLRDIYVGDIATTAQNIGNRNVTAGTNIILGGDLASSGEFPGRIAECAVWNKALTTQEITDYLAGIQASDIAAANLVGYWPLSASASPQVNLGVDATGDVTPAGNAVFDADHPVITSGSATRRPRRRGLMGVGL